jgi:hypothetical protein
LESDLNNKNVCTETRIKLKTKKMQKEKGEAENTVAVKDRNKPKIKQ